MNLKKILYILPPFTFYRRRIMYQSYCGIDFGTTNSAVSVVTQGKTPELIRFGKGKETIPTAIFFPEENTYCPTFGDEAVAQYINGAVGRFMRSLKRILGTDLMDMKTEVNDVRLSYEDIILRFLKYLKETAEKQIGKKLDSVVLGRPVHFQDFAPDSDAKAEAVLRKIAVNAGFKEISFQYEPLAAAFAHETRLRHEQLACVIDIGGGTSDFSVIRLSPQKRNSQNRKKDILANAGIRIGGNDFDRDLSVRGFMPGLGYGTMLKPNPYNGRILPVPFSPYVTLSEWSSINSLYAYKEKEAVRKLYEESAEPDKVGVLYEIIKKELGHTFLNKVEKAKIELSDNKVIKSCLDFLSRMPEIEIDLESFEDAINNDVRKISIALEDCLKASSVSYSEIELVILTGGSTEIPYIKRKIKQLFPFAVLSDARKFSSVATGLAYEGMIRYG